MLRYDHLGSADASVAMLSYVKLCYDHLCKAAAMLCYDPYLSKAATSRAVVDVNRFRDGALL